MDKSTNKAVMLLYLMIVIISCCFAISCISSIRDDRIDPDLEQDRILGRLIQERKNFILSRGIDECIDTTVFYATFSFVFARDSLWLDLAGDYMSPCIMHDSINRKERFKGYFLRDSVYCFFYCFSDSDTLPLAMQKLMKGWRLRDQSENPDFFPEDIDAITWDPRFSQYFVDLDGNYHFIKITR